MSLQVRQGGGRITRGGGTVRPTLGSDNPLTKKEHAPNLSQTFKAQFLADDGINIRGGNDATAAVKENYNRVNRFNSRFSLDFTKKLNEDMSKTIANPSERIKVINEEYDNIAMKLSYLYAQKWNEFKDAGYDEEKSSELADYYIYPLITAEIDSLKMKYPYSFDAQGAIQEAMMQSQGMRNAARFIKRSKKYKALKASLGKGKSSAEVSQAIMAQ